MTTSYRDLWMQGPEVINRITEATGCDHAQALVRLVHECREGSIEGRDFGSRSEQTNSWAVQRGFVPAPDWWDALLSDGEAISACEFPREVVLRLWPVAAHTGIAGAAQPKNSPGPQPKKRDATIQAMLRDYAGAPDRLAVEKQVVLRNKYKVSAETAIKARISALEQLRPNTD